MSRRLHGWRGRATHLSMAASRASRCSHSTPPLAHFRLLLRRLPPQAPAQRLADPRRAAWVTQDILFTQAERLCVQAGAPERCPVSQQLEDALAFLAAVAGGDAAASPAPPRATQHKRKEPEAAAAAPASGSAVKAPRPDEALAAAAGRPTAAAGAGAAIATAAAAAAHRLPASTQQTGSTQRTDVSEVGKPKKVSGRGRGGPPQRPGLARKK